MSEQATKLGQLPGPRATREARELRALQRQMIVRRVQPATSDLLLPHERSMRSVWATFRWRELWTALLAAGLLVGAWVWWCVDALSKSGVAP